MESIFYKAVIHFYQQCEPANDMDVMVRANSVEEVVDKITKKGSSFFNMSIYSMRIKRVEPLLFRYYVD